MTRIVLGGLLAALTLGLGAMAEERRVDDGIYTLGEAAEPTLVPAAQLVESPASGSPPVESGPLAELRERHRAAMEALISSPDAVRDHGQVLAMERELVALKEAQQREELLWLKSDALARGDQALAARLDEALEELTPRILPPAGPAVPRDPATGRTLDGRDEGGVR